MATVETGETTAGGSGEPPAPEGAAGEQLYESPDRKHVDALLDISEEELLKELEPPDQRCSTGWDEAVSMSGSFLVIGFLAPLCLLMMHCFPPGPRMGPSRPAELHTHPELQESKTKGIC